MCAKERSFSRFSTEDSTNVRAALEPKMFLELSPWAKLRSSPCKLRTRRGREDVRLAGSLAAGNPRASRRSRRQWRWGAARAEYLQHLFRSYRRGIDGHLPRSERLGGFHWCCVFLGSDRAHRTCSWQWGSARIEPAPASASAWASRTRKKTSTSRSRSFRRQWRACGSCRQSIRGFMPDAARECIAEIQARARKRGLILLRCPECRHYVVGIIFAAGRFQAPEW